MYILDKDAGAIVDVMKKNDAGVDSTIIGEVDDEFPGKAYLETEIGGTRLLPLLVVEQLPRIC